MMKYNRWPNIVFRMSACMMMFYSLPVFADPMFSASDMLKNIGDQIPNLMRLATAFAYVFGMYLIFLGLLKLKHFGESRTQMSGDKSLAGPIAALVVGSMLIYLPTTVQEGLSTFWTNPSPYDYKDLMPQGQWLEFISICFSVVQLFGTIAVIKGLIMLSKGGGGQQGHIGKAFTHLIAGFFCINISQFVQLIAGTLGIASPI